MTIGDIVTVKITQEMIDEGEPADICLCPTALAVQEATGYEDVSVDDTSADTYKDGKILICWKLPPEVAVWMAEFDAGNHVEPLEFQMWER